MKPLLLVLTLMILLPGACGGREVSEEELAAMAATAREKAERVRGLSLPAAGFTEAVASKDEVASYLDARLTKTGARAQIALAGRLLEDLGAVAPNTDLAGIVERLTREQIAGYYDWEKKTLYLADWMPRFLQEPVLVHETTHALQDAHFDLGRFMTPIPGGDDAQAAIQSVIEGDAMLTMMEDLLPKKSPAGREMAYGMMVGATEQQIAALDAPRVVTEGLIFPYTAGMQLVRAVRDRGGWAAVNRMYEDVPLSTEQVIHPRKYLDAPRDLPQRVAVTVPAGLTAAGWAVAYRGPQGELGWRIVLSAALARDVASKAAEGWDGDELVLLERSAGGPTITLMASVWDDEREAEEATVAMRATKVPPRAIVRDGARVAGLWGEAVADAEGLAREVLETMQADEVATFDALTAVNR
ncbi:MAG: hypothetical protein CVU56_16035 [Deltaproteobacteria bacterium HGW-Deltaproteobacteria-14]|jgi:hypothetical protein|nr:MAG: hypothetical protein CVU56_16035 [Deltaproteobacteria bacterium HGW-Deltaproteobacteria-14]